MKHLLKAIFMLALLASCQRSSSETWEDVKTAGRCLKQGVHSLWGDYHESKEIASREDFKGPEDTNFIPLEEKDLYTEYSQTDTAIAQAKLPDTELPAFLSSKASQFSSVHFETDQHIVKEKEDLITVDKIVKYLKKNPKMCLKVEGHCDKRASSAYNMALGMRRANHLRVLLIRKGIDYSRIFTVSYGKEKPVAVGNDPKTFALNRRSEFKFFTKD